MKMQRDAYEILGVPSNATVEMITRSYQQQQLVTTDDTKDVLARCHTLLVNETSRRMYDITLGVNQEAGDGRTGVDGGIGARLLKDGVYGRLLRLVAKANCPFDLELPSIVVVGQESSGKSSVMERLAMRPAFPTGEDFTTRMPIHMRMRHTRHENRITLGLRKNGEPVPGVRDVDFDSPSPIQDCMADGTVLSTSISAAMRQFIVEAYPDDDGRRVLADNEIVISIYAANVPDLDLVDLPGLVGAPLDVAEATLQLTRRYLARPNTIVLCIVSDQSDTIRGSQALGEVVRAGAQHRALVVLTKVDASSKNPLRLSKRLENPKNLVGFQPRAVVPVRNRSPDDDDNVSLLDVLKNEAVLFESWGMGNAGLPAVLETLNIILEEHITAEWVPKQITFVQKRLKELCQSHAALGPEPERLMKHDVAATITEAWSRVLKALDDYILAGKMDRNCTLQAVQFTRQQFTDFFTPLHAFPAKRPSHDLHSSSDYHTAAMKSIKGAFRTYSQMDWWRGFVCSLVNATIGTDISGYSGYAVLPVQISRLDLVDFISNRVCENLSPLVEQFRADALLFHARVAGYMDCGQRTADSVQNFALSTIWKMMVEHVLSEIVLMSAAKLPAELRETPIAHNERMAIADGIKHSNSLLTELKTLCIPSANEHMAVAPVSSEKPNFHCFNCHQKGHRASECTNPKSSSKCPIAYPACVRWSARNQGSPTMDPSWTHCSGKFRDCDEEL